jgi:hypothetical protein
MNWIENYAKEHKISDENLHIFAIIHSADKCNHLWLDTDILADLSEREHTCILCNTEKMITEEDWKILQNEHKIVKNRIGTLEL